MKKDEVEKVADALIAWLDNQSVSPKDGVQAMAMAIGAMLGYKATGLTALIEGCHLSYQLINATALEVMANSKKLIL